MRVYLQTSGKDLKEKNKTKLANNSLHTLECKRICIQTPES